MAEALERDGEAGRNGIAQIHLDRGNERGPDMMRKTDAPKER